jgi:hypothetical protein
VERQLGRTPLNIEVLTFFVERGLQTGLECSLGLDQLGWQDLYNRSMYALKTRASIDQHHSSSVSAASMAISDSSITCAEKQCHIGDISLALNDSSSMGALDTDANSKERVDVRMCISVASHKNSTSVLQGGGADVAETRPLHVSIWRRSHTVSQWCSTPY